MAFYCTIRYAARSASRRRTLKVPLPRLLPARSTRQAPPHPRRHHEEVAMSIKFGLFVPQGWSMDLVDIDDPEEQYEAMTRVALEAERAGLDSIWLYDHF